MANSNEDHLAKCPYYKTHERHVIKCEGFEKGMAVHAAFSSYSHMVSWKNRYCRKMCYEQCPLAKALNQKYDYT